MNCLVSETNDKAPKQWSTTALVNHVETAMAELGEGSFSPRLRYYLDKPARVDYLRRAMFALAIERWTRSGRERTYAELTRISGASIGSIVRYRKGLSALTELTEPIVHRLIADGFLPIDFTLQRSSKYPLHTSNDRTRGAAE